MLSLEKLANANIKNRAEYSQLSTELTRLEKEKQNELRMVNNQIQRFKARYSKTNFSTDSPEASNVKMYDTHNPGFCFKRNGEHRAQQVVEATPSVDLEHLHFLLFTDGEVDIEKILCLHLLSSHETGHLAPPQRPYTAAFTKKDSPLEQLIERSKDSSQTIPEPILPTYVLDVNKGNPQQILIDHRLATRLLVNEKILELITTVISALEHSNPEKVRHLIGIAEDPSKLKRIFRKQHIQEFVAALKEYSLVNSSFILTQPRKLKALHLEIRTPTGALEELVTFIRANVLQFPKRETVELDAESRELCSVEQTFSLPSKSSKTSSKNYSMVSTLERPLPRSRVREDYIQKNIEAMSSKRNSREQEVATKKRKSLDSSVKNETKNAPGGARKSSLDSSKSRKSVADDKKRRLGDRDRRVGSGIRTEDREHVKYHLKQTTCHACMQKWKAPLPEPKVPKLVSSSPVTSADKFSFNPVIKTDSRRRVRNLIDREQFQLESYDRRFSNASSSSRTKRRSSVRSGTFDLVALNILDLEKIRHEIREKETKKKLEKFLGATNFSQ